MIKCVCKECNKIFFVYPSIIKKHGGKFCSKKCSDINHGKSMHNNKNPNWKGGKVKRICKVCGIIFYVKQHKIRDGYGIYCSQKCCKKEHGSKIKGKHHNGLFKEKNPNWKGGITPLTHLFRESKKYKLWRLSVFEKDNFKCCVCGDNHGGNLEAHHIKYVSDLFKKYKPKDIEEIFEISEFWDINNGITLCKNCHKELHKRVI